MRLVLCHGVFDLLHPGHVAHLQEARKMGDYLVVSVTMDAHVNKGAGRPIMLCEERMQMLRAVRCVSAVAMAANGVDALERWKPAVFVKGHDYASKGVKEASYCAQHHIKIKFTKPSTYSTGKIIERVLKCHELSSRAALDTKVQSSSRSSLPVAMKYR